jgi:long-chain acyl-CoA synthetase
MPPILRKTITETFLERIKSSPTAVGFQFKSKNPEIAPTGQWKSITFSDFYNDCRIVSYGLMGLGLRKGDRVIILSNTRYEWSLCDMAILGASAVTVPIYASSTSDDVAYITNHSEARVMIAEDANQLKKIFEKRMESPDRFPFLEKIVVIESSAMALALDHIEISKDVITLQALRELGKREEAQEPSRFDENLLSAQPSDLITICYTSGTTGIPKGVMLTHDNLISVLEDSVATLSQFVDPENEVILSFLPFSHIFGKVESMTIYTFGWKQVFAESVDKLMSNLKEISPTILFAIPWIFEKVRKRIEENLELESATQRKLFEWALQVGKRYYGAIWSKSRPSILETVEYRVAKLFVFNFVMQQFGGRLRFAVCGGAPLPAEVGEFFQIAGIPILEGYGLTETCAPVSINTPDDIRFGVVGRPLPEVMIKIAEDGEILIKSRKVFEAYYKMPEETLQVKSSGWYHTEDIGFIDSEGFLHITDRKKDLIVTSLGKNIAPQKIENLTKGQKLIHQFVVCGDQRHYLTALVTLHRDPIIEYANEHQILFSEYAELIKNPKIISLVQRIIDDVNKRLANFEAIKKFVILPEDFAIEKGELTPSLKIRRKVIQERYKSELDSMYGDSVRVPLDSLD